VRRTYAMSSATGNKNKPACRWSWIGDILLSKYQVLIVERDPSNAGRISSSLIDNGYEIVAASTLQAAQSLLAERDFEAIVVDQLSGDTELVQTISDWRRQGIGAPILFVGPVDSLSERIAGLEAGADGYLHEPLDGAELDARVRALLRARQRHAALAADTISFGSITVDRRQRTAQRNGVPLRLAPREYRLLEILCEAQGNVVTRAALLEKVWKLHFDPRTKIIETHISRVRDRLDEAGQGEVIETIRGVGYRLRHDGGPDAGGNA